MINEDADRAELTVHYQRGDDTRFWMQIIGEPVRDGEGEGDRRGRRVCRCG